MEVIELACRLCQKPVSMSVIPEDIIDWRNGDRHIQEVMPYLDADEREMLISGTCPDCWERMFGGE